MVRNITHARIHASENVWQFPFNTIITQFIATVHIGCRAYIYPCRMSTTETRVSQWHCNYTRCLLHTSLVGQALWTFKRPLFDLCIAMSRWVLRNGVNYKVCMIIYERIFEPKIKGMNWPKNGLPCLLDILPVFVCHILAISVRFQWVLGSLNIFLSLYGIHTHIYISPKAWSLR